jgi:hypothetical protein
MYMFLNGRMRAGKRVDGTVEVHKCRVAVCLCIVENALDAGFFCDLFCCVDFILARWSEVSFPCCECKFDGMGCTFEICSENGGFVTLAGYYCDFKRGFE